MFDKSSFIAFCQSLEHFECYCYCKMIRNVSCIFWAWVIISLGLGSLERDKASRFRMFKVVIAKEALALDGHHEARGTWERDWDPMVLGAIEENEPCYILYR